MSPRTIAALEGQAWAGHSPGIILAVRRLLQRTSYTTRPRRGRSQDWTDTKDPKPGAQPYPSFWLAGRRGLVLGRAGLCSVLAWAVRMGTLFVVLVLLCFLRGGRCRQQEGSRERRKERTNGRQKERTNQRTRGRNTESNK